MRIKKTFLIHESDGESMLVPTGKAGFSGLVRGNQTLGIILGMLKEDTTEEKIIAEMMRRYPDAGDAICADVRKALDSLRKIGAIEE